MTHTILGASGGVSLANVADAVACSSAALGVEDVAELRTVLVRDGDRLVNFASVLRIGFPTVSTPDKPVAKSAGDITLVAAPFTPSDFVGVASLTEALGAWRSFALYGNELQFQESTYVYRQPSRSAWSREPCWTLQAHERTADWANRSVPGGPFMHVDSGFFGETVGTSAWEWLGDPSVRESHSIPNSYWILMRDRRAYLQDLTLDGDQLSVQVAALGEHEVYCTAIATDFVGGVSRQTQRLVSPTSAITLALPVRRLQVYLTDRQGAWYDRYEESEHVVPWGSSVLRPPRQAFDPRYQEFREALEQGECETVEFKEWLPVNRDKPKSYELLKAASAFANAVGGVIYVGVSDDAEVVGTSKALRGEFGRQDLRDMASLQNAYAQAVHRILSEGVSPSLGHAIEWVTHAGKDVLRIAIPVAQGSLHHVVEDGAIFVRRGASDRKASPADLERIFVTRMNEQG